MARPRKAAPDAAEPAADSTPIESVSAESTLAEHIAAARAGADHATQCALDGLSMALTEMQNRAAHLAHAAPDLAERIANL